MRRRDRAATAWLTLDAADRAPRRFWARLLDALLACPAVAPGSPLRRLAAAGAGPDLLADLADALDPLALRLVLDDAHLMPADVTRDLYALVRGGSPGLRLVLVGRGDPDGLPVGRCGWRSGSASCGPTGSGSPRPSRPPCSTRSACGSRPTRPRSCTTSPTGGPRACGWPPSACAATPTRTASAPRWPARSSRGSPPTNARCWGAPASATRSRPRWPSSWPAGPTPRPCSTGWSTAPGSSAARGRAARTTTSTRSSGAGCSPT
ncbi:hypothetical protein BJF78_08520 [Pseudonocardia sp. CNS-139]|nr:hypothetical protein BJF78_08520 [Pseudonocardia sp. CNS-139]